MTKRLSKAAVRMLKRLHDGRWYDWEDKPGPVMQELIEAGKVVAIGRVALIVRAWVPKGTRPLQCEEIPPYPDGGSDGTA